MIKSSSEMKQGKPEIDLNGPEGNVYVLFAYCRQWLEQMMWSTEDIDGYIEKLESLADYDTIIETIDETFGEYVIFYR